MPTIITPGTAIDDLRFTGVDSNAQNEWKQILKNNLHRLGQSTTRDALEEQLWNLRIPGIGERAIALTTEYIMSIYEDITDDAVY